MNEDSQDGGRSGDWYFAASGECGECAGPQPGAVDGGFKEWNCGGGITAGGAGGSENFGEWRKRGRRGDCDERDDGCG